MSVAKFSTDNKRWGRNWIFSDRIELYTHVNILKRIYDNAFSEFTNI